MKSEMWLIWKEPKTRRRYKVGTLNYDNSIYIFKYTNPELDEAKETGFKFFPGFENLDEVYKNEDLFINIATRLPNVNRPDYLELLNSFGLDSTSTKLEILKATKGRLITDNYEFVSAFDKNKIEFNVAGTNHSEDIDICKKVIAINDKLDLELEPENKFDDDAIKVILNKNNKVYHLGYVPRYYSKDLAILLNKKLEYSAMIKSLNFNSELSDENITVLVKLIFK